MTDPSKSGWVRMSSGMDVELQHGVPVRVSDNGLGGPSAENKLIREVTSLTGLIVNVGDWVSGGDTTERVARLNIDGSQFGEVLRRLALSSAALYVDRFHKPVSADSVDWDSAEFTTDFNHAIQHCSLIRDRVSMDEYFDSYVAAMHAETSRLVDAGISPMVEAE